VSESLLRRSVRGILETTRVNRERIAEQELGSLMISRKIKFEQNPVFFEGGLLFLAEEPLKIYRIAISTVLSEPLRIYPLLAFEEAFKASEAVEVEDISCLVRGNKLLCQELLSSASRLLGKDSSFGKGYRAVLSIQGVGDKFGFSILPRGCEKYGDILESHSLRKSCTEYSLYLEKMITVS